MLARDKRLTKKKDFDRIFKEGISFFNDFLGAKIKENNLKKNRFGVIVSNKISKKAFERNKIKRQIKNIIRNKNLLKNNGFDCVIITLPVIKTMKFKSIEKGLDYVFFRVEQKINKRIKKSFNNDNQVLSKNIIT